jgi:GDP-D-mannose 3',5'-epimerase
MKNVLVTGAGGFLGGHLTNRLLDEGYNVTCADIKPEKDWFQVSNKSKNFFNLNLRIKENCENVTNNIDLVFNLACDHGGIGHIMNNHYECMKDILINTHLIQASVDNKVQRYLYTSSACVYNTLYQEDLTSSRSLKESDAFPALPDSQYGWEKLFSEMLCEQYMKKHGIKVYLPRIHGCYGTHNHFNDGKEKAPNALTRKAILASNGNKEIEIWGDGKQERSFMYFEDCIDGFMKIINSNYHQPINLGSSKLVSINDCVDVLESILNTKFVRKYNLQGTQGVRSRNSDNSKILEILNWEPKKDINYGFSKLVDHINNKLKEI